MKPRVIVSMLAMACTFPLLGCNSSDDPAVSPNIADTKDLVEQAQLDWQAAGLQNYAFTRTFMVGECDGGIVADAPPPMVNVVLDTGEPYAISPWYNEARLIGDNYRYDGYERLHEALMDILDEGPVLLGRNRNNIDELPTFDDRGVVTEWFHKENSRENNGCTYTASTRRLVGLDELSYPLTNYVHEFNQGAQTWIEADLQDYTYRVRFIRGSCAEPQTSSLTTIRVVDGRVDESATEWDGDEDRDLFEATLGMVFYELTYAMAQLPDTLVAAAESDTPIAYDPNFGFPLSFYAEYGSESTESCGATGIIVESFE
ncbi:DUF6174 domain-containing protein [Aliidiomarina soli]|nr:DUF6174 domain-containing protein [Aliidiomarina soli]